MDFASRRILGPYDVYAFTGPTPVIVDTLPFGQVAGGQISLRVDDNLAGGAGTVSSQQVTTNNILACALVEVSIVGSIMGIEDTLKCVDMRMITGPINYRFGEGDAFENIFIKARMLRGGLRNLNAAGHAETQATAFSSFRGFYTRLTITVQPRLVFPEKPRKAC